MVRLFGLLVLAISIQHSALAEERIIAFVSDVTVLQDGSLDVTESITVHAEGQRIKRGIYRDIPTSYPHPEYGSWGLKAKTPVWVSSLTRNGEPESWHLGEVSNGERIFFGHADRMLTPGEHRYQLRYTIERQIAKDQARAVLYWNVTGNGWQFPIDKARINVKLPNGTPLQQQQAWTGRQGSTESHATFTTRADGAAVIATRQRLARYEGLTVKLAFAETALNLPTEGKWRDLYQDNKGYVWGWALLAAMLLFYTVAWWRTGRDPELGIIVARYRPLRDLSAAAHRAIYRNTADDTSFAVGILSAAVKGHLTIEEEDKGVFKLAAIDGADLNNLAPSELLLVRRLFANYQYVVLGASYNSRIDELKDDYEKQLKSEFAEPAHVNHLPWLIGGAVLGLLGLVLLFTSIGGGFAQYLLHAVFVAIFVFVFGSKVIKLKRLSLFYLLAVGAVAMGLFALFKSQPQYATPLLFFGSVLGAFTYLLPAPKVAGQKLINQIEGFRLYLAKAEHDSLQRLTLPKKTPQLYEELLPFAIALDLETEWSEQFVEVFANAGQDQSSHRQFHTNWYHGSSNFSSASSTALAAGLATSVAAASTPPSSSGSSGGGFSGGGGGGGGGGGW